MPASERRFTYLPGQFVCVAFAAGPPSGQSHPLTLSSTPTRTEALQVIIRSCGDWTARIGELQPGSNACTQGPYGRFSHRLDGRQDGIVMIAGGIGITPLLSMLRHFNDCRDRRRITLIWSNRTREHLFGVDELDAMTRNLTSFQWIPIFTR